MNIEIELLKAQNKAMRSYFVSLLSVIFQNDNQQKADGSKVWLAKYWMWRYERENLSPLSYTLPPASQDLKLIDRRYFQLQVLMDVAYIQGGLEAYGIPRKISPYAADLANRVFLHSDGGENGMIALIDDYYNS